MFKRDIIIIEDLGQYVWADSYAASDDTAR